MSGIIAYAKIRYRRETPNGERIWTDATLTKRSNQSDRGFVRKVNKIMGAHHEKGIMQKEIVNDKTNISYYDKCEVDITSKVLTMYV